MARQPKCKQCKQPFDRARPLQSCCSPECAYQYAKASREKKERKEYRETKIKIKSRGDWMREAQAAVNKYIRLRDEGEPCISCGSLWNNTFQAGHFMATSIRPNLRFNELNINSQCVRDNMHLHGNLLGYRKGLIKKIGIEKVEFLEGHHEPIKYSVDELKEIIKSYRIKSSELMSKRNEKSN